tara:strand:+ start:679 stop:1296 length:618 start_codon:yes stop_codon:yes gene_type:complete
MNYERGQVIPMDRKTGIVGDKLAKPVWHTLFVPPNRERSTSEALKAKKCFAFYPQRTSRWFVRGKKVERDFPQITGMIYVKFTRQPHWHIMRERRLIAGVMSVGNRPIAFPSEIIRRLQGLPARNEALMQARDELARICEGDTAIVQEGPLAGHFVQVSEVKPDGTVFWFTDLLKGQSKAGSLLQDGGASHGEIEARADQIMGVA